MIYFYYIQLFKESAAADFESIFIFDWRSQHPFFSILWVKDVSSLQW